MQQECRTCGVVKPLTTEHFNFRRDTMKFRSDCIPCRKEYNDKYRDANQERLNDYDKERYHTDPVRNAYTAARYKTFRLEHPDRVKMYVRNWTDRNVERMAVSRRASQQVQYALKKGRLIRPTACDNCGRTCKPDAAHSDYSQPLDVRWLCRSCHCRWDHTTPKTA